MRWFKHMTNASKDESLLQIIDEFGHEGYGMYFVTIENIALKVSEKNNSSLKLSEKNWRRTLRVSTKKLKKFLVLAEELELFSVKTEDKYITIDCPKILKYRDEWTRKKIATNKKNSGATLTKTQEESRKQITDTKNKSKLTDTTTKEKQLLSFFECVQLKFDTPEIRSLLEQKLQTNLEENVKEAIEYANTTTKAKNAKAFQSYLSLTIEKQWAKGFKSSNIKKNRQKLNFLDLKGIKIAGHFHKVSDKTIRNDDGTIFAVEADIRNMINSKKAIPVFKDIF